MVTLTLTNTQARTLQALLASVEADAPAKPARTRKAAAPKPARKLTSKQRKAWNTKFGALMRACPAGSYREAMNQWADVQAMRDAGKTPAQARKALGFTAR